MYVKRRGYPRNEFNESCLFQALESSLDSTIAKANQALDLSDNGGKITAAELESTVDALQKSIESVVSGGLVRSQPLVAEATKVHKSLRDMATKTMVSAVDLVSIFECMCWRAW